MSSRRRCEHRWPQYPRLLGTPLAAGLPSSARYAATASVRGLLVAEIQVLVPYRIHPSIYPVKGDRSWLVKCVCNVPLYIASYGHITGRTDAGLSGLDSTHTDTHRSLARHVPPCAPRLHALHMHTT